MSRSFTRAGLVALLITISGTLGLARADYQWVWELPDHPHHVTLDGPGTPFNDLHVSIPHPPVIDSHVPAPHATGMPYNNDFNHGTGNMSFGPGSVNFTGNEKIGVVWTSKFASDALITAQFTLNNVNVGESINYQDKYGVYFDYKYDRSASTMYAYLVNPTNAAVNYAIDGGFYGVNTAYLPNPEGPNSFFSNNATATGTSFVSSSGGTIAANSSPLFLGSFTLDDQNNINNTGYLLLRGTFTFADGSILDRADAAIGTVPEPASFLLLGAGLLLIGHRHATKSGRRRLGLRHRQPAVRPGPRRQNRRPGPPRTRPGPGAILAQPPRSIPRIHCGTRQDRTNSNRTSNAPAPGKAGRVSGTGHARGTARLSDPGRRDEGSTPEMARRPPERQPFCDLARRRADRRQTPVRLGRRARRPRSRLENVPGSQRR